MFVVFEVILVCYCDFKVVVVFVIINMVEGLSDVKLLYV